MSCPIVIRGATTAGPVTLRVTPLIAASSVGGVSFLELYDGEPIPEGYTGYILRRPV